MKPQPQFNKKRFIAICVLLAAILVGFIIYDYFNFSVSSTDPAVNQIDTWTPFFKIDFNKPIAKQGLSVSITPEVFYGSKYAVSGNQLTVYLSVPLSSAKRYTLTVNEIKDTGGQTIRNLSFTFRPASKNIDQLPDEQEEALIGRNESSPVYKNPILTHLPYNSVDFDLSASFPAGKNNQPTLVLHATLYVPSSETGNLEQQAISQYQQEVYQYIESLGLSPSNYMIVYTISNT